MASMGEPETPSHYSLKEKKSGKSVSGPRAPPLRVRCALQHRGQQLESKLRGRAIGENRGNFSIELSLRRS